MCIRDSYHNMQEHPRTRLLRYIAEHTAVFVKQMKSDLGMSTGTAYYYLAQLEPVLKRDEARRYYLSAEGRLLLDKYRGNYSEAEKVIFEKTASSNTATLELTKYRSLYDTIATILDTKTIFTVTQVVRKARLTGKRAEMLLSFLKEKGLIEQVRPEELPKPYSDQKRRFLRVTRRGGIFLRKYRELQRMIR